MSRDCFHRVSRILQSADRETIFHVGKEQKYRFSAVTESLEEREELEARRPVSCYCTSTSKIK